MIINCDGLCEPTNPNGYACWGWVAMMGKDKAGEACGCVGHGDGMTNNVAEYSGLLAALRWATEHRHPSLEVVSDSELMVKQMNGQYKVRAPQLVDLYQQARALSRKLEWFRIRHVRRAHNSKADTLANRAMDQGMRR